MQIAGDTEVREATVMPVATGMALFLCLAALKQQRPGAEAVVWCRCDQNSAIKAVALAGLRLEVVEMKLVGEALETDVEAVRARVEQLGVEKVACVFRYEEKGTSEKMLKSLYFSSTTSCFAPRVPDNVVELARLCKEKNLPHLVNNAYGVSTTASFFSI